MEQPQIDSVPASRRDNRRSVERVAHTSRQGPVGPQNQFPRVITERRYCAT